MQSIFQLSFVFVLMCFCLFACKEPANTEQSNVPEADPYASIEDQAAVDLLKKAMDAAGGLEKWNSLRTISFEKRFALFAEDGSVEQARKQTYTQYNQLAKARMMPVMDSTKEIIYQLGPDLIVIGGDVNPAMDKTSLRNSVLSASFVISIPFKLLDEGAEISYAGTDTLEEGQAVEVLKVVYRPDQHANHSTPDTWWHYFDANSYKHLAYMVQHADHFSYVQNTELTELAGIIFPLSRKSWRVNEERKLLWLRADYEYGNFEIEL